MINLLENLFELCLNGEEVPETRKNKRGGEERMSAKIIEDSQ